MREIIGVVYGTLLGRRIGGEILHQGKKCWPGCYMDAAVYLEVQEVDAFEHMIFVSEGAPFL